MANSNSGPFNAIIGFFETLLQKIPIIVLTFLTVTILLLCWSSNHYLRELITIELKEQTQKKERVASIYDKVIRLNINSQVYKERIHADLDELTIILTRWHTLAVSNKLIEEKNLKMSIEERNKKSLEYIDKLEKLVNSIKVNLNQLNASLTIFTDEGDSNVQ